MAKKRANGEGNIRKRKDGRWEGRYTAGYDEKTGKRLIKNVLGKTQAEVKEKLAKAVAEAESVDVRRADEYTLGTWLQTWYELYAKPHLRFSTAEYYRRGIELHIMPRLGDIPLKKLIGRDLQWLYKDLQEHGRLREAQKGKQPGLSDSTIRGIHTMLHSALDRAVKERLIVRNPADDCVPPKNPKHEMRDPAAGTNQVLPNRSRAARRPAHVLSGTHQRTAQRRTGGAPMGRLGHRKQDDFRQQAGRPQQRRRAGHHAPENGKLHPQNLDSTGCRRSAGRRTPESIPAALGCSHLRKQARCTIRIRWSTSTRKF